MQRIRCLMVIFVLGCSVPVVAGESYHVVKVKDWNKNTTYAVMTERELQDALQTLQKQASAMSKAADLAKEAWRLDETNGKKPFPQRVLMPPTYTKVGTFDTMEAAEIKCERNQDNQREDLASESKTRQKSNPRDAAREAESDSRQMVARALFEAKLQELTAAKPDAKQAAVEAKPAAVAKPAGH